MGSSKNPIGVFRASPNRSVNFASWRLRTNIFLIILLFCFTSCATSPKAPIDGSLNELAMLPAGAKVYLLADTVKARGVLDALSSNFLDAKDAAGVLDSTERAAAAVFPDGAAGSRKFFIAASGNYPSTRANFSFAFSRSWKKQKSSSGSSFWYSQANDLALALGPKLALVSNIDPLSQFPREIPPEGFREFQIENQDLALSGWGNNAEESINKFLESMQIPLQMPIEDFFFGAAGLAGNWEFIFRIKVPSAAQARSLVSLFTIARFFVLSGLAAPAVPDGSFSPLDTAMLLFANAPEQNGEYLTIRTPSLNEDEIALLFNVFSIYSN